MRFLSALVCLCCLVCCLVLATPQKSDACHPGAAANIARFLGGAGYGSYGANANFLANANANADCGAVPSFNFNAGVAPPPIICPAPAYGQSFLTGPRFAGPRFFEPRFGLGVRGHLHLRR